MSRTASSIPSGSPPLRLRGRDATGRYAAAGASIPATSSGTPIATGPGRPVRMCMKARRITPAVCAGSISTVDHLVTGRNSSTKGISLVWRLAIWSRSLCPARNSTGTESPQLFTSPPIRLAAAGPASVNATAGTPAARAKPSQMSNATRSWRAYISAISGRSAIPSSRGPTDCPDSPAASLTPSATRQSLMSSATFTPPPADRGIPGIPSSSRAPRTQSQLGEIRVNRRRAANGCQPPAGYPPSASLTCRSRSSNSAWSA